jgi:5-methylcytosine-specific restriction endonuclease McrA
MIKYVTLGGDNISIKKLCGYGGCTVLVNIGTTYCLIHQQEYEERQKQRHKEYKAGRNDKELEQFYKSKEWIVVRDSVKIRDKGLCLMCLADSVINYYQTIHHIVEVKDDWNQRLDIDSCLSLCEHHHQIVHKAYKRDSISKINMQQKLRELIKKFKTEVRGRS